MRRRRARGKPCVTWRRILRGCADAAQAIRRRTRQRPTAARCSAQADARAHLIGGVQPTRGHLVRSARSPDVIVVTRHCAGRAARLPRFHPAGPATTSSIVAAVRLDRILRGVTLVARSGGAVTRVNALRSAAERQRRIAPRAPCHCGEPCDRVLQTWELPPDASDTKSGCALSMTFAAADFDGICA